MNAFSTSIDILKSLMTVKMGKSAVSISELLRGEFCLSFEIFIKIGRFFKA